MPTGPAEAAGAPAPGRRALYPVSLVVSGRPCLVVGGGPVAVRKVSGLAECGAVVSVVAPRIDSSIEDLAARAGGSHTSGRRSPGSVTIARRPYRPGEAAEYRLVITATGVPEVDRRVAADAEAAGVWVNSADDTEHCTFMLPAVHRDGPVTVAVSTGGASPALASWLRQRVAQQLDPGTGSLADVLDTARRALQERGVETATVDWHGLLDGPLPALVATGRTAEALELVDRAAAAAERRPAS